MPEQLPSSRKKIATHLLESDFEIRAVKDLLDHADISMAMIYIHFERYYVSNGDNLSILYMQFY
jgi:site-specific recombinase XerC